MDLESDSKSKDNGKCDGEIVDTNDTNLTNAVEIGGTVGKTESPAAGSPSPSPATKGRGLRKWRRIHRESGKETSNNFDSNKKRGMTTGVKQSEGSSSSTNAMSNVLGNALDHISLFGDFSSGKGPDFASRADSENSEDRNSRSSTAASAPRGTREVPVVGSGFNLSKNLVQNQQEKSQNTTKKARGVRIKKENSISSVESDSRSSNFVFLQAANSMTSNGRPNGRSGNYDEDDSDDAHATFSKNEADYEKVSHEDLTGGNSRAKKEKIDDHVGSGNPDPLVELILPLHLAQEALEKEVEKLRDVGKEDTLSSDEHEADFHSKLEEAFKTLELKNTKISELESTLNFTKMNTEYEELLTQRIAAELEYLVISNTTQNLKAGLMGRINLAVDQKNVSAQALEEEVDKKLKNRVWRYVCCLVIQLVLLLVVLYMVVLKFWSKTVEVIPT